MGIDSYATTVQENLEKAFKAVAKNTFANINNMMLKKVTLHHILLQILKRQQMMPKLVTCQKIISKVLTRQQMRL